MTDDPQPEESGPPLSRREARERAAAARPPADEGSAEEATAGQPAPTIPREGSIEALLDGDPQERPKRKRGRGCLIAALIVLVVVGGMAAAGVWAWNTYGERVQEALGLDGTHDYAEGEATGEAVVTVEEGDTGESMSPKLHEAGVTLEEDSFTRYLRESEQNPTLYPGVYLLQQKMTSEAALAALEDPESRQDNTVQLPEGYTVEATITRITESVDVSSDELEKAVADPSDYGVEDDSLEGWLFPATYTFGPEATAEDVIARMVERTRESLAAAEVPEDEVHDVLTIASIIQREARFEDDFYKVSRVIHNRLDSSTWGDTNGLLQMDSTTQYGYGETHTGSASTSREAREDDNPWNTYLHKGLPAGPVSNPGDVSIDAAMNPADGPWLYFVTVNLNTGETAFSTTYAEHERNVDEWRSWCVENPDAGC
ncbi:MAG: endolytic transglycosylase MltG [Microbacterium sp.]